MLNTNYIHKFFTMVFDIKIETLDLVNLYLKQNQKLVIS